MVVVKTEVHMF